MHHLFVFFLVMLSTHIVYTQSGAGKPAEKSRRESLSERRFDRFERKQEIGGFVRLMPNTIVKDADPESNQGYLVNAMGQRWPVFFTQEKLKKDDPVSASNFYLGPFFDLGERVTKHAYLTLPLR